MAKIVITIEDMPGGGVKTESTPKFAAMMRMVQSGHPLTSAHGYAMTALNAILESNKRNRLNIIVPRVGRA